MTLRTMLATALAVTAAGSATAAAHPGGGGGAVFTLSNQTDGNAVLAFERAQDGTLTPAGSDATGGTGTGAGLGNQGAVVLDDEGRWLYAVDPGSGDVNAYRTRGTDLRQTAHVASGGAQPISVTEHDGTVYVLNAGDAAVPANIQGFKRSWSGRLTPIPGSNRPLSAAAPGAAQIEFSPDGSRLVVTEKGTDTIGTFRVDRWGRAGTATFTASAAKTPFGFAFDRRGTLVVSDAVGGAPLGSGLSSYRLGKGGTLRTVTGFAGTTQTAACWVVITRHGVAFTTNTGSNTVSSFDVGRDGALTLKAAVAGTTSAGPIDAALSRDDGFLYVLDAGADDVTAFAVGHDGALTAVETETGLPDGATGLAAR